MGLDRDLVSSLNSANTPTLSPWIEILDKWLSLTVSSFIPSFPLLPPVLPSVNSHAPWLLRPTPSSSVLPSFRPFYILSFCLSPPGHVYHVYFLSSFFSLPSFNPPVPYTELSMQEMICHIPIGSTKGLPGQTQNQPVYRINIHSTTVVQPTNPPG